MSSGLGTRHRRATVLLVALAALILVFRGLWLPAIGRFLVVNDPLQQTDAVVILGGGGPQRVAHGAELFHDGYAQWFIVSDSPLNIPGIRDSYAHLMRTEALWRGVPQDRILTTPGVVRTTYEEALAVRRLATARGLRSLIVVTDPFHTRRARMAFFEAFRDMDIRVLVQAANGSWYRADSWWQDQDAMRETWTEYLKLVLYVIGYR